MADEKNTINYGSKKELGLKPKSSLENSLGLSSAFSVYEILNQKMQEGNKISGGEILTHLYRTENVHNELKNELDKLKSQKEKFQTDFLTCHETLSLANQKNDFLEKEIILHNSFDKLRGLMQNIGAALLGLLPFIITNLKDENQIFIGILSGVVSILLLLLPLVLKSKKQ